MTTMEQDLDRLIYLSIKQGRNEERKRILEIIENIDYDDVIEENEYGKTMNSNFPRNLIKQIKEKEQ